MTADDRAAFGALMFMLGDTFGEPVTDIRIEAYFSALSDLHVESVLGAGQRAIRECRFFPRPVELRELVTGSGDDAAELAWNEVRRLVRRVGYMGSPTFPDEPTRRAALEIYGGWVALCSSLPCEGPELLGARKAFIANYKAYASRERREQELLPPAVTLKQLNAIRSEHP